MEDQWMVRDDLATLAGINENIQVLATGANGHEAIALTEEHRPDVILMDIKMPGMNGIDATREIKQRHPNINAIVLTTVDAAFQRLVDELTSRERDVLRLLATGATNPEIDRKLHLSAGTVNNHVSSILRQLQTSDRTQAAVIASNCNV